MVDKRGKCIKCGRRTRHQNQKGEWFCVICEMGIEDKVGVSEREVLKMIKEKHLTPLEIKSLLSGEKQASVGKEYSIGKTKIIFGVIADGHIGNKFYDSALMDHAAKMFNEKKVDFVIHGGDICEGHYESKRQGSIFELEHVGGDEQIKRAVKELGKIKQPIYAITGNHETNTFYKMSGFDIGKQLSEKLPNFKYLGQGRGIIKLPNNKKIEVLHPDGGSSYAISYRSQKIAESLEGGTKPEVLLIAHYHKAEYLFYRNIHIIQTGCLEGQTDFMRNKHLSAHKGFWIVEMNLDKKGVTNISPTFYPAYD